jgi:hypothetical protein
LMRKRLEKLLWFWINWFWILRMCE